MFVEKYTRGYDSSVNDKLTTVKPFNLDLLLSSDGDIINDYYDYDNIDGRILLYLDGDLMGNVSIGNHSIETVYNVGAQELVMGHSHHGNAENLTGMQDEVRIYNRTLSQEEIQENMNNKLSGRESNLIGYWSFDKGSGNILYDLTENYNCDFYGDPQWVKI